MGGGDEAMLSAQERAALAQLEARAAADDPRLADQLRGQGAGSRRHRGRRGLAAAAALAGRVWRRGRPALWGPVLLVVGLALIVVGLAVSVALGVAGVALATAGMALVVEAVAARARRWPPAAPRPPFEG